MTYETVAAIIAILKEVLEASHISDPLARFEAYAKAEKDALALLYPHKP